MVRDVAMVLSPPRSNYPDLRAAGEIIITHTEPEALIIAENAPGVALYAGERAVLDPAPLKGVAAAYPSVAATIRASVRTRPVYALAPSQQPNGPDLTALGLTDLTVEAVATDPLTGLSL